MDALFIFGAKYLFLVIAAIAGVYFLKLPRTQQKKMLLFAVVTLPLMFLALRAAGFLYYDARPFVVGNFTPLIPHAPDNGFPSDHTMLCAAIATIVFPFNKKISAALWLLTVFVGISRVYTGVHHFVDVLGSMLIAILVGALVYYALKHFKKLA